MSNYRIEQHSLFQNLSTVLEIFLHNFELNKTKFKKYIFIYNFLLFLNHNIYFQFHILKQNIFRSISIHKN